VQSIFGILGGIGAEPQNLGAPIAALSDDEQAAGARFLQRLLAAFEEIEGDAGEEPPLGDC
jgi:hypothetical protein